MSRTSTPATPLASANPSHAGEASSPLKLGLAALFMLPFVVLGLSLLLFGVAPTLVDWARAQQWQATPAIVESAATLWEPGQLGAAAYGVEVRFRYTAAGQEYRGQRASLHIGNGNASLYYQQLGERLEAAQRTGTPVPVWVNPAQPTESMADRSLRLDLLALELVVALGFTGCGLGVWWVLLRIWRSQRRGSLPRSAS
ncbi:DUF3592 domain-containing protein [Acidovorax temperans]|uniref:DUF3592 domain-containing protein n=1 Tax=Acidovorax temperans TaxID=80878 RepID=UPI001A93CB7E|nr:DUF3592 domain-containing protein [Acidovorax temperans]MBO0943456.1 DUF3592 domain-containing protein [Acidovorax temperans]WCT26100.1 DUF3592 domain-containing protein [Acidovorax temperans]